MIQKIRNLHKKIFEKRVRYFSYLYGIYGEFFTIIFFTLKGYLLLQRRYRNKITEIDLIFYKKRTIIFMEVKSRRNTTDFYEIVRNKQMNNIKKASEIFIKKKKEFQKYDIRFDIFILNGFFRFNHLENV